MFAKAGLIGVLLGASPGYSQDVPRASQADINQMRQQLDEQAKKLAAQQNQLDEELRKLEEHKRAFEETRQQLE